jgi:anaerobic magnesium-protoporphyrin IX monomethyl ester cyclase
MILLFNPRATKPRNRRLPLSVLSLAAILEGREEYVIVDGNVEDYPYDSISKLITEHNIELLAVTVMPGPQMAAAIPVCKKVREQHPKVPICWGGYFPSIYPSTALNARYVDYAVRGQGEDTLLELIDSIRGNRAMDSILGLSYKEAGLLQRHNPERPMKSPDVFPWMPYHRLPVEKYIRPSYFGKRTTVHHASIGCPFQCNFCGIHAAYGNRELMEAPQRTADILAHQVREYRIDSVQFYDMNFFLKESQAVELAERLIPLKLRWWCEGRVDILTKYSDSTLQKLKEAGCAMIFIGAESGSDWVLEEMNKGITTKQTIEFAERIRKFGIIPEFSFVIGNPRDPEGDTRATLDFIRKIKHLNPDSEIILYHYTPVPQRDSMYGNLDGQFEFPATPEEWASQKWMDFTVRKDPSTSWMSEENKRLIDNFETVISSRWPTVQDVRAPRWSRMLLKSLSAWRYRTKLYSNPVELKWAQNFISLRKPKAESL